MIWQHDSEYVGPEAGQPRRANEKNGQATLYAGKRPFLVPGAPPVTYHWPFPSVIIVFCFRNRQNDSQKIVFLIVRSLVTTHTFAPKDQTNLTRATRLNVVDATFDEDHNQQALDSLVTEKLTRCPHPKALTNLNLTLFSQGTTGDEPVLSPTEMACG